jgi:hypothetical protein
MHPNPISDACNPWPPNGFVFIKNNFEMQRSGGIFEEKLRGFRCRRKGYCCGIWWRVVKKK